MSRLIRLILVATLCSLISPTAAPAWKNGPSGGDSFGTHDWVLEEAYHLAAPASDSWIDLSVAKLATDDPDTVLHDTYHHVYDVWGSTWGDAPEHIAEVYADVITQRDAGNYELASQTLGCLAHYYADICNPLHTDQVSPEDDTLHENYESDVQGYTDAVAENRAWVVSDGLTTVSSVKTKAIAAATDAHTDYTLLVSEYDTNGYNATVDGITQSALNLAVNDLADIISTVDSNEATEWQGIARWAGTDRYETAVQTSRKAFASGADTVVVATGKNWPDALCAAPLCDVEDAPLLLVKPTSIPSSVLAEIARLGAADAIILGGADVVSSGVETKLKETLGSSHVRRIAGTNRYSTAAMIANEVKSASSWNGSAFYATGDNFPDALGASSIAASQRMPILLTKATSIPSQVLAVDGAVSHAYIVGGSDVVGTEVSTALKSRMGTANVVRLAGANRYATTKAVVDYGVSHWGTNVSRVGVSTGTNFPDALAAGVAMGKYDQAQLLTAPTVLSPATAAFMTGKKGVTNAIVMFGESDAVSDGVATHIRAILDPDFTYTQQLTTASAWVSNTTPAQYSNVTVYGKALDQYGNPIQGANVKSTWHYKTTTPVTSATSGSDGIASMTRNISGAAAGYTVNVDVAVTFGGKTLTRVTAFTPK